MKRIFLIGLVFLSVGLSAQISLLPKKNRVVVFQSGVTISYDSYKQSTEGEDLINSTDTLPYVSGTGTDQIFDLSSLEDTAWNKNAYIGNAFGLPEYYDFPYVNIYYDTSNPYHWKIKDFHYRYYEEQADALTNIAFAKLSYSGGVLQSSDELLLYNTEQTGTDLADIKSYIGIVADYYGPNLVTNGVFDTDSYWSKIMATISSGKAYLDGAIGISLLYQAILTEGKKYREYFDIDAIVGAISVINDGGIVYGNFTTTGTKTVDFTHSVSNENIIFRCNNGVNSATIDNVSVKQFFQNYYENE